jgi:hypothetical protein
MKNSDINLHTSSSKYPFLPDFTLTCILSMNLEKSLNTKYHKNLPSGCQIVPYGWTGRKTTDGERDMTKPKGASCNFANTPTKVQLYWNEGRR